MYDPRLYNWSKYRFCRTWFKMVTFFDNVPCIVFIFFFLLFLRNGSIIAIVNNIYQDSQIDEKTIQDAITNSSNTFFQETSYSGRFPLSTFHIWFWRPAPELIKSSCRDSYPLFPSSRPVCAGPFTVWSRHYKLQQLCWTGWMRVFGSLHSFPLLNHILQRWNRSSPPALLCH